MLKLVKLKKIDIATGNAVKRKNKTKYGANSTYVADLARFNLRIFIWPGCERRSKFLNVFTALRRLI